MKKVLLLLLCFPLLQLACDRDKCGDSRYFNVTGMRVIPMAKTNKPNGQEHHITLYREDSTLFEQFYLDGYLQAEYHAQTKPAGLSLFPAAYATDCASPGYDGSREQLAAIYLIALGYYSNSVQPGDTIRNSILINDQPAAQYLAENSQGIRDQYFTIRLTERPNKKFYQSFNVVYQLTNGETYKVTTPRIRLY